MPFGQVGTFYEDRGLTPGSVITELLAGLDVEAYLRAVGCSEGDLAAIRGNAFALAENGASAEALPASLNTLN